VKVKTLNEEIARIKSIAADIASKTFTGKTIQEQMKEMFPTISPIEYDASEKVWDELYRKKRQLQEELEQVCREIETVESIITRPIKEDK
jgi:wobble nucleotide-excising tRNase